MPAAALARDDAPFKGRYLRPGTLVSPTGKPKTLRGVHPNEGVRAAYSRHLHALIDRANANVSQRILAQWRDNPPGAAEGFRASPIDGLVSVMRELAARWQRNFDEAAPRLAEWFATHASQRSDYALRQILRDGGFSVRFQATPMVEEAMRASVGENVALIRSIGAQHLSEVEGLVMRSAQAGRDAGTLAKELQERFGVTKRRAAFIARDQMEKMTAVVTRARQTELGIERAKWLHTGGGKHPRPSHVAASGKVYEIAKGMFIDGAWIQPGELIACRCISQPIIEGFD